MGVYIAFAVKIFFTLLFEYLSLTGSKTILIYCKGDKPKLDIFVFIYV